jgi:hypothetical protein
MKSTSEKTKKKAKTGTNRRSSDTGIDVENQRGSRNIKREDEDEDLLDDE